jgi:hypothetical protein
MGIVALRDFVPFLLKCQSQQICGVMTDCRMSGYEKLRRNRSIDRSEGSLLFVFTNLCSADASTIKNASWIRRPTFLNAA